MSSLDEGIRRTRRCDLEAGGPLEGVRAFRGLAIALALSVPLWALVAAAVFGVGTLFR